MKKHRITAVALCSLLGLSVCAGGYPAIQTAQYVFAEEGDVTPEQIVLQQDRGEELTVESGATVVLDLNGFDMTAKVTNNGTLTVTNSKETGAFRLTGSESGVLSAIENNGTLTIDGVDVYCTGTGAQTEANAVTNKGTLTLLDGEIVAKSLGTRWGFGINNLAGATIADIAGGSVVSLIAHTGSGSNAIAVNNSGTIEKISGGSVYAEHNGTGGFATAIRVNTGGSIKSIEGGKISALADNGNGETKAYGVYNLDGGISSVTGGEIKGVSTAAQWAFGVWNAGEIGSISGGTFISIVDHAKNAPNAIALSNDKNIGSVTGGTFYAYSTTPNGDTIGIRTKGKIDSVSGGAVRINKIKEANYFLDNDSGVTTFAAGCELSVRSKSGYRYVLGEGETVEEDYPDGESLLTATVKDASGVTVKQYKLAGTERGDGAAIGKIEYDSIDEAIAASDAGDTVVLLKNAQDGFTVPDGKDVTVDLNGFEIIGSVVNYGTLRLCDSDGAGRLYKKTSVNGLDPLIANYGVLVYGNVNARIDGAGDGPQADGIYNYEGAVLTVTGGTLRAVSYGTKWSHAIVNEGTVKEISGGNFQTLSFSTETASNIVALSNINNGVVESISGGVLYAQSSGKGTAVGLRLQGASVLRNMTGGTVKAVMNGAVGTAKAYALFAESNGTAAAIADGAFYAVSFNGDAYAFYNKSSATVTGGYFKAEGAANSFSVNNEGTLSLSGGIFDSGKSGQDAAFVSGDGAVNYAQDTLLREMSCATVRYAAKDGDVVVEQMDGETFIGVDVFRDGERLYGYRAYEKDGYYLDRFYANGENGEMIDKDKLSTLSASTTVYAAYENVPLYYFLGSSVTYGQANDGSSFVNEIAGMLNCVCVKEAVSGTTLANNGSGSYVARMIANFDKKAKVEHLIVQLSTNDVAQHASIGTISNTKNIEEIDPSTTLGAIEFIIAYAKMTWNCEGGIHEPDH